MRGMQQNSSDTCIAHSRSYNYSASIFKTVPAFPGERWYESLQLIKCKQGNNQTIVLRVLGKPELVLVQFQE